MNKTDQTKQNTKTTYIYVVHSVIPKYFSSAQSALRNVLATSSKTVFVEGMTEAQEMEAYRNGVAIYK